jgi:hypothetical protein
MAQPAREAVAEPAQPTEADGANASQYEEEQEVSKVAEQPAKPAKHTDVRQARFWRAASGVLPSWLVPSELAEQPAVAIDKLFVERLALEKMALGSSRETAMAAAKAEAEAETKAEADAVEVWRNFLADFAALPTAQPVETAPVSPGEEGEGEEDKEEEEEEKKEEDDDDDDDDEARQESMSQILARIFAVDGDALTLLFLHFCSFSWHSGQLICRRLRLPGWHLAMEHLATAEQLGGGEHVETMEPLGTFASQSAAAFRHASQPSSAVPSLTLGGFVRALRWLALSSAMALWYDSLEASVGFSPSQLLAAVVESTGRTFAAATRHWQAQAGLRAAPATAEGSRADLAADEPQLASDEAGDADLGQGHELASAWPPSAAPRSGRQCVRDAAREIEQNAQPWSLLFTAYASELPIHSRHPAGIESESNAAAADGNAADGNAAKGNAADCNAGGDVPCGVRAEALQQLLLDFALHRAACGAAAVRTASARLGLSEAVPLSLVQLVALLLGTVTGAAVLPGTATPLHEALSLASNAALCSRLLALGRPLPLPLPPLPPLPTGSSLASQLPAAAKYHMSDDAIEAGLERLLARSSGGGGEGGKGAAMPSLLSEALAPPPCSAGVLRLVRQAVLYGEGGGAAAPNDATRALALLRQAREAHARELGAMAQFPPTAAAFFLIAMGNACLAARRPADALAHFVFARRAAAPLRPTDATHAHVACALGSACFFLHRYSLAAALFARTLVARTVQDSHVLDTVLALHNLAASIECAGAGTDAYVLYRRAEALMRREVNPVHPRMEVLLGNLSRQQHLLYHDSIDSYDRHVPVTDLFSWKGWTV